jgi:hypothetical protein
VRLPKSNAWSAAVLVDEVDAGRVRRESDCLVVDPKMLF